MSFGPRIPFSIPNEDDKTQTGTNAEQLMEWPLTDEGFHQTHNGRQRRWAVERPLGYGGTQPRDIYVWKED